MCVYWYQVSIISQALQRIFLHFIKQIVSKHILFAVVSVFISFLPGPNHFWNQGSTILWYLYLDFSIQHI